MKTMEKIGSLEEERSIRNRSSSGSESDSQPEVKSKSPQDVPAITRSLAMEDRDRCCDLIRLYLKARALSLLPSLRLLTIAVYSTRMERRGEGAPG